MTLFLQSTTIDTAGGLTIDCNLFTMARACVRACEKSFVQSLLSFDRIKIRWVIRLVQQKTLSVNTWEFHSLSSTLDGEHLFVAPQSNINCRNTLAGVKVIARSNWSSEIVGSSDACCHDNYPVNNRNERYQTLSHHRKKGILLSTWSTGDAKGSFVLAAR